MGCRIKARAGLAWKLLLKTSKIMETRASEGDFDAGVAAPPRVRRSKPRRKPKRRPKAALAEADEPIRPAAGTLARTKSLLLAALRVWELKQGIRD